MPTVKHGGENMIVWGAMAASGVQRLVFTSVNMDQHQYKRIIENNFKPSVDCLDLGPRLIFQ